MVDMPFGRWPFQAPVREMRNLADRRLEMQGIGMPFPAPHPDGIHWVTSAFGVMISRLDGSGLRPVFLPPHEEGAPPVPAWGSIVSSGASPWIAFSRGGMFAPDDAPVEIWRVYPDGSGLENLTPAVEGEVASNNAFPAYSPDGQRIVFRSSRDGNQEIYIMDAGGQHPRRLTRNAARDTMPGFSPGGRQIAFVSDRDGDHEIYTLDLAADGTPHGMPRPITNSPGFDTHPRYSPDVQWLIFSSERGGFVDERPLDFFNPQPYGELFAVRLQDLDTVRLTHNHHEDGLAVWLDRPLDAMPEGGSDTLAAAP